MWNKILAFNSFVVMPITCIVLIYTALQAVFFWDWKPFWITLSFAIVALIMQVIIATLND